MVAQETLDFARRLTATEEAGRRAMLNFMEALADPGDPQHQNAALKELTRSLNHAAKLPEHMFEWTAEVVNPMRGMSHIDMMDHLDPLVHGVTQLRNALNANGTDTAIFHLRDALGSICGVHRDLVCFCREQKNCKPIEIPDIPTTRDGGGR